MGNININPLETDTDPNVLQFCDILSFNLFISYLLQPTRFARNSKTLIDNLYFKELCTTEAATNNFL